MVQCSQEPNAENTSVFRHAYLSKGDLLQIQIASDTPIDLHMHTTYSDGRWSAEQLLDYLSEQSFGLIAVTDHDRTDTVTSIQQLGVQRQIVVLAGVEISAQWHGNMTDVLCYGFDPQDEALRAIADQIRQEQKDNAENVYEELLHRGYHFPHRQELLKANAGQLRVAGDCANLLIKHGYMNNWQSALEAIRDAGYYEIRADIAEVAATVHRSGGIVLIAHPGRGKLEAEAFAYYTPDLLDQIRAEIPLDGIEAYYPKHPPEMVESYRAYAQQHGLLISAGSDSHGPPGRMPIPYRAELCRHLLERIGIQVHHH